MSLSLNSIFDSKERASGSDSGASSLTSAHIRWDALRRVIGRLWKSNEGSQSSQDEETKDSRLKVFVVQFRLSCCCCCCWLPFEFWVLALFFLSRVAGNCHGNVDTHTEYVTWIPSRKITTRHCQGSLLFISCIQQLRILFRLPFAGFKRETGAN